MRYSKQNYINAGKHAHMIGVELVDNPHSNETFKALWEEGWKREAGKIDVKLKVDKRPNKFRRIPASKAII